MTTVKNVTEETKKLKSLMGFLVPIKLTTKTEVEKKKKIQKNLLNQSKNKNNKCFSQVLKSLLSESFPVLEIIVHLTSLGCTPTLC